MSRLARLAIAASLASLLAACDGKRFDVAPAPTTGAAGACATCHVAEFRSARHHVGEKPTTCGVCHTQDGWHPSRVDHAWPLTGAHQKATCFSCHHGDPPVFKGTPRECVGCHRAQYDKAPHHVAEHYPTTCADCHGTPAWKPLLPGANHAHAPPPNAPNAPTDTADPAITIAPDEADAAAPAPPATPAKAGGRARPKPKPTPPITPKPPDVVTTPSRHY